MVPATVEAAFRGAVEEALVNVAKHSGSDEAQLSIRTEHDVIEVEVSDAGIGANSRTLAPTSIVERCHRVGATASHLTRAMLTPVA